MKKTLAVFTAIVLVGSVFFSARWVVGNLAPQFVQARVEVFKEDTFGPNSLFGTARDIVAKEGAANLFLQYLDASVNTEVSLQLDVRKFNSVVLLRSLPRDFQVREVYMENNFIDIYTESSAGKFQEFVYNCKDSGQFQEVEGYQNSFMVRIILKKEVV